MAWRAVCVCVCLSMAGLMPVERQSGFRDCLGRIETARRPQGHRHAIVLRDPRQNKPSQWENAIDLRSFVRVVESYCLSRLSDANLLRADGVKHRPDRTGDNTEVLYAVLGTPFIVGLSPPRAIRSDVLTCPAPAAPRGPRGRRRHPCLPLGLDRLAVRLTVAGSVCTRRSRATSRCRGSASVNLMKVAPAWLQPALAPGLAPGEK